MLNCGIQHNLMPKFYALLAVAQSTKACGQIAEFIITWVGRYCLVKGGQCILHDHGGIIEITGQGGRHHSFYLRQSLQV